MLLKQEFIVRGQKLYKQSVTKIVADSINMITFSFDCDELWNDVTKTVIITSNEITTRVILVDNCIPIERMPILKAGVCTLSLLGHKDSTRYTTNEIKFNIVPVGSLDTTQTLPEYVPEDAYATILYVSNQAYNMAKLAINAQLKEGQQIEGVATLDNNSKVIQTALNSEKLAGQSLDYFLSVANFNDFSSYTTTTLQAQSNFNVTISQQLQSKFDSSKIGKLLWSGELSEVGTTITIPDLDKYTIIGVQINGTDMPLILCDTKSNAIFGSSSFFIHEYNTICHSYVTFNKVDDCTIKLSSKPFREDRIKGTFAVHSTYEFNVTKIYGII